MQGKPMTNLHELAYTAVLKGAVIRDVGVEFENILYYDYKCESNNSATLNWTDFPRENWHLIENLSAGFWL